MGIFSFCSRYSIPRGRTPKEHALCLIEMCKWHADELNKAITVFEFTFYYQKLVDILDELIWLNERKKIHMYPTPRRDLANIESNIEATINKFMTQALDSIKSTGLERADAIDDLLNSISEDETLCTLMTPGNVAKIQKYKEDVESIRNEIKLNSLGKQGGMDLSKFDPMDVIVSLEKRIKLLYEYFSYRGSKPSIGKSLFEEFKSNCLSCSLPLASQIRLESLLEEYEEKFMPPNILYAIDAMCGTDFERWCAVLLSDLGFLDVSLTKRSGDQGVDILAKKEGIHYAIQCKCYSSDLSNAPVQQVHAGKSLYNCHVGVVMTNRHFTAGAKELATATGVLLWDRDKLISLIESVQEK